MATCKMKDFCMFRPFSRKAHTQYCLCLLEVPNNMVWILPSKPHYMWNANTASCWSLPAPDFRVGIPRCYMTPSPGTSDYLITFSFEVDEGSTSPSQCMVGGNTKQAFKWSCEVGLTFFLLGIQICRLQSSLKPIFLQASFRFCLTHGDFGDGVSWPSPRRAGVLLLSLGHTLGLSFFFFFLSLCLKRN